MQFGFWCIFVVAAFVLQADISVSAQSGNQHTRSRWEKLMYEDPKAVIQETTFEVAKNPQNAIALRMRSSAFYRSNEPEKGKADAIAVLALLKNPTGAEDFEAKCYAERRLEKYDEAILDCTKAIALDPKYAWAYYNRAAANEGKKLLEKAVADYTKAIELNSRFIDPYSRRGYIFSDNKEYDKAIADFTKVVEFEPKRASGYHARGYLYHMKRDYGLAIADYSKAIEVDPKSTATYMNRGNAYSESGQHDLAIADYTKAIEADPKGVGPYYRRGLAYGNKEDHDKAITDLKGDRTCAESDGDLFGKGE